MTEENITASGDQPLDNNDTVYASVRFFIDDGSLKADFSSDKLSKPLQQDDIIALLKSSKLEKHLLDEDKILNLVTQSTENYAGEISIEKHTDASYQIIVDKQQMNLSIVITPAVGGNDLLFDSVYDEIIESLVIAQYIDKLQLKLSLKDTEGQALIIATAVVPIDGVDSSFEILFTLDSKTGPKNDASGQVNHYETHNYISVPVGQQLMKRIPHTQAVLGKTIYGEDIAGIDGKKIEFSLDDTVCLDKANDNLLIAAIKGHPIASEFGVHIDDTLTVKNANLRSGNIYFDGSVEITGDVMPNVVIEATGDIHVHGMVENASLIAGNDITVCTGILSSKLFDHHDDDDEFMPECTLVAEGNIFAKYCNSITASAKKDIRIETYSMNSYLSAEGKIIVGVNSGKGVLIGGINKGTLGISANIFGSEAYVRTLLICGDLKTIKKQNKKNVNALKRNTSELYLLEKVLDKITSSGSPTKVGKLILQKAKKIHDEIKRIQDKISTLQGQLKKGKKLLDLNKNVSIEVKRKLYPNVHISINEVNMANSLEHEQTTITCEAYQIHFN